MTKDNVDPGLLELDDEALIEKWVISTELGIPNSGGSGVEGNPTRAVVARALDSAKRPGQMALGCVAGAGAKQGFLSHFVGQWVHAAVAPCGGQDLPW
jgi:hypothetical protein